jgi:hypothetical protein
MGTGLPVYKDTNRDGSGQSQIRTLSAQMKGDILQALHIQTVCPSRRAAASRRDIQSIPKISGVLTNPDLLVYNFCACTLRLYFGKHVIDDLGKNPNIFKPVISA